MSAPTPEEGLAELYYSDESVTLYHGDCRPALAAMADRSVDLVITDPPFDARTHAMARSNSTQNSLSGRGSRTLSGGSTVRFDAWDHSAQTALFASLGRITRRWVVSNASTDTAFRFEPTNCQWATAVEQASNKTHCPTCTCHQGDPS